jgi:DNA-directed RNA polymerase sigma subunit (sigma70/sigma32)
MRKNIDRLTTSWSWSTRRRVLFNLRRGKSAREIAGLVGITERRVWQIKAEALKEHIETTPLP